MSLDERAVAHRGGAGLAAENTFAAFDLSYALGLRLLETDVRVTRDGVAVAFHDATLARTTGAPHRVADLSWEQMRCLRIDGEPLARLDDVLMRYPDASFLVDVKARGNIDGLVASLERTGAAERVCVADGRDAWLRHVAGVTGCARSLGWGELSMLSTCAKLGAPVPRTLGRGAFAAHVATRLAGVSWMADPRAAARLVDLTHRLGLRLITWTVDDAAQMAHYLDAGADAIITDRPDRLREVLIARDEWTARGRRDRTAADAPGATFAHPVAAPSRPHAA